MSREPLYQRIVYEQEGCFTLREQNCQALACIYFEHDPGRRAATKLLSRDEARRMAANFAKLPDLVGPQLHLSVRRSPHVASALEPTSATSPYVLSFQKEREARQKAAGSGG